MTQALEIKNLKKVYATGVEALRGIDLTVEEGDFMPCLVLMVRGNLRQLGSSLHL